MPRTSRIKDNYGIYHVTQRGSGLVKLFEDDEDRKAFLEIVRKAGEKNNFRILAHCIFAPEEYHLILDSNGSDISKVMKEINITYSIYKNCAGCLFKDRFRSELLSQALEKGRGKAPFSPAAPDCQFFLQTLREFKAVGDLPFEPLAGSVQQVFERGCLERICTVEEAAERLLSEARERGKAPQEILKDKALRNALIVEMKACSTLSLREIGQVFGLSESAVSKLLNAR